jgi:hypothetical protein
MEGWLDVLNRILLLKSKNEQNLGKLLNHILHPEAYYQCLLKKANSIHANSKGLSSLISLPL